LKRIYQDDPHKHRVLLLETCRDRLHIMIKSDWWRDSADVQEGELWQSLSEDLNQKARQMGAVKFVNWLDECCSHTLQMGTTQAVQIAHPNWSSNVLSREQVHSPGMTLEMCKPEKLTSSSHPLTDWQQLALTRQTAKAPGHHRWIAQAALAASFLAGAWIAGHHSSTNPARREGTSTASKAVELSLISDFHYQHVQLNLDA
jgi:hypothetical protein